MLAGPLPPQRGVGAGLRAWQDRGLSADVPVHVGTARQDVSLLERRCSDLSDFGRPQ